MPSAAQLRASIASLRSNPAYGHAPAGVDDKDRIIKGFAVITKGEAETHDMMIDDKTLDQTVALGNQNANGVKVRFDHPAACGTSMGTLLGRAKNFTRDGDMVRADLHISPTANDSPQFPDMGDYILALAKEEPKMFGTSIVFSGQPEFGGTKEEPIKFARLERLRAVDVVDSPAANPGGMFGIEHDGSLAARAGAFLDKWAANYFSQNPQPQPEGNKIMSTPASPETTVLSAESVKTYLTGLSLEAATALFSARPDVNAALKAEGQKAERAYRQEFEAVVLASKFSAEEGRAFSDKYFGRAIDLVKEFALERIANRTQPVGEGGVPAPVIPIPGAPATTDAAQRAELAQRWADNKDIRLSRQVRTDDAKSPEWIAGMEKYITGAMSVVTGSKK